MRQTKYNRNLNLTLITETVTLPVSTMAALQSAKGTKTIRLTPTTMVKPLNLPTFSLFTTAFDSTAKHQTDQHPKDTDKQSGKRNVGAGDHTDLPTAAVAAAAAAAASPDTAPRATNKVCRAAHFGSQRIEEKAGADGH